MRMRAPSSMHVCINLPHKKYLQVIMINIRHRYNTMLKGNGNELRKRKPPLITVAGIALKGQADHISITVPLEVLFFSMIFFLLKFEFYF